MQMNLASHIFPLINRHIVSELHFHSYKKFPLLREIATFSLKSCPLPHIWEGCNDLLLWWTSIEGCLEDGGHLWSSRPQVLGSRSLGSQMSRALQPGCDCHASGHGILEAGHVRDSGPLSVQDRKDEKPKQWSRRTIGCPKYLFIDNLYTLIKIKRWIHLLFWILWVENKSII